MYGIWFDDSYLGTYQYTVQGLKNYTVCSSIFLEFSHTIHRELKEMANKLRKVGTLAAMFAKKHRWTRSRTPPKPRLHIYENAHSASPYNANSLPCFRVFPRSVFRGMQIAMGDNLRKKRGKYSYFP